MADLDEKHLDTSPTSSPKFFGKRPAFGSTKHAASHASLKPALDHSDSDSIEDDNDYDSPLQQFLQANTEFELRDPADPNSRQSYKDINPANPLDNKKYSMEPDMLFGWKPKYVPQVPVPLRFYSPMVEEIITTLHKPNETGYFPEIVYQGFRPENTLLMHERFMGESYTVKFSPFILAKHAFFCKFTGNNLINPKRPFIGMKEGVQKDCLIFDSIFEHGNLDTVVRKSTNEYDLFLRVDSNTKGHTSWYYFTIKNMTKGQKVRFNIMNLSKPDSLYQRGMKPYVYSQKLNEQNKSDWQQTGENVSYTPSTPNYSGQNFVEPNQKKYHKVTFDYTFEFDNDTVSFALCPPYSYSQLVQWLQGLAEIHNPTKPGGSHLTTSKLCYSLGGINVPLLTITDPDESEIPIAKRQYIVCTGRVHPGETNGSWMIQGFVNELCSDKPESQYLRKRYVFKIVPMLNPDGVVAGNHRTGMCGNDMNRKFVSPKDVLHPNIIALKDVVRDIVNDEKEVFAYLDFHGHSLKKNVFTYGAEFPVYDTNYYRVKILPKLLSKRNPMFRFQSCTFTVSKPKMTTARAVFSMKYGIVHFYTIEASYANYVNAERETVAFDANGFMVMGASVTSALHDYRRLIDEEESAAAALKMKRDDLIKMVMARLDSDETNGERAGNRSKLGQTKEDRTSSRGASESLTSKDGVDGEKRKTKKFIIRKGKGGEEGNQGNNGDTSIDVTSKTKLDSFRTKESESKLDAKDGRDSLLQGNKLGIFRLMEEIRGDFMNKIEEDRAESDSFSEGGSDSEGSEDDFNNDEMKKLQKNILNRVEKFQDICKNGEKYEVKSYRKEKKPKKANGNNVKTPKKEKEKAKVPQPLQRKGSDYTPKERKYSETPKTSLSRPMTIQTQNVTPDKNSFNSNRVVVPQKRGDTSARASSSKPKFSLTPKEVQIDNDTSGAVNQIKNQLSSFYLGTLSNSKKEGGAFRNVMTAQNSRKHLGIQAKTQKMSEDLASRPIDMSTDKLPSAFEPAKLIHMNTHMEKSYHVQRLSKSPLDFLFSMKGGPGPVVSQNTKETEPNAGEPEGFMNVHVDRLFKPSLGLSKFKVGGREAHSTEQENVQDLLANLYSLRSPSFQPSQQMTTQEQNPTQEQDVISPNGKYSTRLKTGVPYMQVATAQLYNFSKNDSVPQSITPLKKDTKLPMSFESYKKMLHARRKTDEAYGRKSTGIK